MDENIMKLRDQMETMKNWPLPPDYVINIRIPDTDLINRRQGEKIDPMTGLLYIKEQYAPTPVEKVVSFVLIDENNDKEINASRLLSNKQMMMMLQAMLMKMVMMVRKKLKKKNK